MKRLLVIIASIFLSMAAITSFAGSDLRVGVVDMHAVMAKSAQLKKVNADLKARFKPRQEKIMKQEQAVRDEYAKFTRDSAVMSKADKDKAEKNLQEKQKTLQQEEFSFQQDMMKAQQEAMQKFVATIKTISKKVAQKEKLDFVLTNDTVIYMNESYDITQKVIQALPKS